MIWFFLSIFLLVGEVTCLTISPPEKFLASPENTTVLEGHRTILRCKMKETIHTCQWYYQEKGIDFFDVRISPLPIKTFRATNDNDCSIEFSSTKIQQSGQWVCRGFKIHARKYIMSSPVILNVIPKEKDIKNENDLEPEARTESNPEYDLPDDSMSDSAFLSSEGMEGHVINSHLGYEVLLDCQAAVPLVKCAWITPDGIQYKRQGPKPINHNHIEIVGDMKEGNCSLLTTVKYQDEGNWRCIVTAQGGLGERVGPLIHLHIMELGPHSKDGGLTLGQQTGASLVTILVATLIVLLFIVVILCLYIYRQRWFKNSTHSQFGSANGSQADYNNYACTWLPTFGIKEQQLLNDQETASNHYTRYLDMTGSAAAPGREGYVMFPAASSIRSSTSSRTTLSTLPAGRNSSLGNNSGHPSISESLPSMSSVEDFPFDKKGLVRSPSNYSTGHLYEEIKYGQKDDFDMMKKPLTQEDKEGYMIPKPSTQIHIMQKKEKEDNNPKNVHKAPPYSKVGESGLVPAQIESNWASNPTYGMDNSKKETNEGAIKDTKELGDSYDVPLDPPVPIRIDSAQGDPLASYDVPNKVPTPIPSGDEDNISNH